VGFDGAIGFVGGAIPLPFPGGMRLFELLLFGGGGGGGSLGGMQPLGYLAPFLLFGGGGNPFDPFPFPPFPLSDLDVGAFVGGQGKLILVSMS
jgi:hypothetical protein